MKSRFQPEVRGRILGAVAAGASLEDACRHAGLPSDTLKSWLRRGHREKSTEFAAFADAVRAARREPLSEHEVVVLLGQRARGGSVTACVALLRWHRQQPQVVAGADPFSALDGGGPAIASLAARRTA